MAEKIICVVGPTACGKTKLGVLLAKRYDGEVVSADSMQIYKGMTIGTAAPTAEEMEGVPHHMIAVADPAEQWSAARYARAAVPIVDDILRRGKRPILVGGTGLWLDAVVQGRTFAGGHAGGAVRRELQAQLAREGIGPLLEELRQVDPEAAERLHPADEKRILRALEVYRETGKTISAHNAETRDMPPRYDAVWIGLQFRDRADMKTLIDRTCARYTEMGGKEFYFILTAAEESVEMMERTVECFRGFLDCLDDPEERGVVYGVGAWQAGEIEGMPAMDEVYELGRRV